MTSIHNRPGRRTANSDSWFQTVILTCVVVLLSFLTAKVGGALVLRPQMLWPLWPGCGFLLAVLLLVPRRSWLILVPAGLAGFVLYDLLAGLALRPIAFLILSDTVEVLVAAFGVGYAFNGPPRLNSIKSLAKYSFFAIILAPLSAAFIGTAAFDGNYWIRWRIGFFTEALALLTLTPAILSWVSTRHEWIRKSGAVYFEEATLIAGLTLLGYFAFVSRPTSSLPVLLYAILPFLLWSALRFGLRGISTSTIVVAFLSIWGAVHVRGPFAGAEPLKNVISLQLFLFVAATPFIVLAVLVEERKQAERALRESEERLRIAVEVGKMYAWEWDPATDVVLRSAECTDILGTSDAARELTARDYFTYIHPDDQAEVWGLVQSLTPESPVYRTQYRRFRPDGALVWLEENGCATFDGGGKMVRLVGMTADITKRKGAEESLMNSEEKFSKAFRQSPMAMTVTSIKDHRYIDVNDTFERLSGWRRDEVIGRTPFDIGLWVDPAQRLEITKQLLNGGNIRNVETRFRMRDGSIRVALVTAEAITLNGEPCIIGVVADITERKQAEDALSDSQQRLRAIVASAMDSIISLDEQQRIVVFNEAAERMFQCSAAEVIGQPVERFIPERFRSAHAAHIRHFGETGDTTRAMGALGSFWALRANGEEFQIEASISQVETSGQKLFTVILRDITERQQAEDALRQSEERFSKVFRSSPLAVTISTEAEGRYLDVNKAFLQMLGYNRLEVIGRTARDLNFWAEPFERVEMIRQLKKNGRVTGVHTRFTTSKGKMREGEVSAELVEVDGQRCILAITRDITETRLLEEQLRQAQKMEAVGLLAGGISHDFNNLLNVILGNTDLLLEKIESAKLQKYAEQIKKATQRGAQLTRQLLAFSRKQVLRPTTLDLNALVRDIVKILPRLVGEDMHIVVEAQNNLASIRADSGQVEQVLMNLATNARDAMPNGGTFTIRTENSELGPNDVARYPYVLPGRYVCLSVRDTGLGMSEDVRARAFEPFFTTKPEGRGTGLGLATVFGIVKQSGGYVWISSTVGVGTTFDIYFPRVDEAASALEDGLEVQGESRKGRETILVLEDEESLREMTCEMLTGTGYSVLQAGRGGQAIALARQYMGPIHLIVSDVILPDISGLSAVSAIQASHPETKILFVSGYAEGSLVQKVLNGGAMLLQKPISRSDLMQKVHEILHLSNLSGQGVQSQ